MYGRQEEPVDRANNNNKKVQVMSNTEFSFLESGIDKNEGGKDFARLEEGVHQGIIVGAIQRKMRNSDGTEKPVVEFIIQVAEGDAIHYIRTKSFSSMYLYSDNSNLWKMLKGLTQATSVDDPKYLERLTILGIVRDNKVNPSHFIGLNLQIMTTDNARPNGKVYPEIVSYKHSASKNEPKVDEISEKMLDWDGSLMGKILMPQITVKAKEATAQALAPATPAPTPKVVVKPTDEDSWVND